MDTIYRTPIQNTICSSNYLCPKFVRNFFCFEHTSHNVHNCYVISFSYSISRGVHLIANWCSILCCSKKFVSVRYSLPLWVLSVLILQPLYFSTNALNAFKASQTSYSCFKKCIQVFLLKSSIKVIKYLQPPGIGISAKHKFE